METGATHGLNQQALVPLEDGLLHGVAEVCLVWIEAQCYLLEDLEGGFEARLWNYLLHPNTRFLPSGQAISGVTLALKMLAEGVG